MASKFGRLAVSEVSRERVSRKERVRRWDSELPHKSFPLTYGFALRLART